MVKRKRPISLSFVLLRFVGMIIGCMLLCSLVWMYGYRQLRTMGVIYQSAVSNQQVERMLDENPDIFVSPKEDFLAEYALYDTNGEVIESNVNKKTQTDLVHYLQADNQDIHVLTHTYEDGSTIVIRWHFRAEFVNQGLRKKLPPFEYVWWGALVVAWVLCLLLNTLWLRKYLAAKLKLFSEVSAKVGAQELDFTIPHAGIKEYDQALDAMEHMREALYSSLSSQWAAQQEREAEIAALAHDLKTPLTLVGGNAELLLEEELPGSSQKRVETILANNDRAKQYVFSLLDASVGSEEPLVESSLSDLLDQLYQNTKAIAEAKGVQLSVQNELEGSKKIQKERLLRALGNIVQNAIEYTPTGKTVMVKGCMEEREWSIVVRDEGPGFSEEALHHATQRLWRDDTARGANGHNGLGLWFAAQVIKTQKGQLNLQNWDLGGEVIVKL